ncbi:MAG: asparaginase [Gemmatimonadaceae bacterium]|nr:asparaginase [Gemmatimonadaceae bacterium]
MSALDLDIVVTRGRDPFVADGTWATLGWGDDRLALTCASHGGEPEHVALAAAMLGDLGLTDAALACGPHDPLAPRGARLAAESGRPLTRLHNNCSGKHAAMLAAATVHRWPIAGYERPTHPVQERIRAALPHFTGLDADAVDRATDGCGVPVFILPVRAMATAWARLAHRAHEEAAAARILDAMGAHPFLVGGTDRFDTRVIEATAGNVIAKIGAEGVHSLCIRDRGLGLAIKVADGASRAQLPAVLHLLRTLQALPEPLPPALQDFLVAPVLDTRGTRVGTIRPAALDPEERMMPA